MEIWKDIEDYEDYYQISSLGRIRNKKENRILKPSKSGGYYHISLRYGNKKEMLVHRLVAKAFIPNPLNLNYVNHKDENKLNNNVDNLEWCSHKDNQIHMIKSRLTKKTQPVICIETGITYNSLSEAERETTTSRKLIKKSCENGKKYGGCHWRLVV